MASANDMILPPALRDLAALLKPAANIPPALLASAERFKSLRRAIHSHPELGGDVPLTSELVASTLLELGYEVHKVGGHGIVAQLRVGTGPRSIGLRADMDALPILECTGLPYASKVPGKMHACGHDGHTATLLAAAEYLSATRSFDGTLNLIFQPDEEGMTGALTMMEDGLFERFPCDSIYAYHNAPGLPVGAAVAQSGPMGGSSDQVTVTFRGHGGHAAAPDLVRDPTLPMALSIVALQSIVARNVPPSEAAVISVGKAAAGSAYNVAPETATLGLSVRANNPEVRDLLETRIKEVITGQAASCGMTADIEYRKHAPVIVNGKVETALVRDALSSVLGATNVIQVPPATRMGSDDFAWMLERVPGCYFALGNGWPGEPNVGCSIHNDQYDFNDELIAVGAACWVALVEKYLRDV